MRQSESSWPSGWMESIDVPSEPRPVFVCVGGERVCVCRGGEGECVCIYMYEY